MTQWGLDTLFNSAKRHMDDEKRRLQSTREEVGDNSGGNRINLESGKVTIRKRDDELDEQDDAAGSAASLEGSATAATNAKSASKSGSKAKSTADLRETPAQARARARREVARQRKRT